LPTEILLRVRKANTVFPKIIDRVIFSEESVSDDPDWSEGGRNVETLERGDTCAAGVEDIVCCGEGEVVAGEGEGYVGEGSDFVALDCVSSIPGLFGADFFV
jgi:hypothetical protein